MVRLLSYASTQDTETCAVKYRTTWRSPRFVENFDHHDRLRYILFVLLYAILANLPFWVASRWLGLLPLGWFCLEYAAIGLLALFLPRILVAGLLFVAIAADLTSAVSKTYYLAPSDCLANFESMQEFPGHRLVVAAGVVALTLLILAAALWFPVVKIRGAYRRLAAWSLVGFIVLALAADYLSVARENASLVNPFHALRPGDTNRFSDFSNLWIGRYPIIRLRRDELLFGSVGATKNASLSTTRPIPSATERALLAAGVAAGKPTGDLPDVVVILLESWGLSANPMIRDTLVHDYTEPNVAARYNVLQGTVGFYGSTVGGESRELCNSRIGLQIANVPGDGLQTCLPDRLAALGYTSVAVHGMSSSMLGRQTWYNTIGFQKEWFRDTFRDEGLPDCRGAFVGTCDAALATWIGHRLQTRQPKPALTYWVTLNSHLPVPVPAALTGGAPCSPDRVLASQPALCSWYQLVSRVHSSVAQLATGKLGRPTVFVIVGDHAPPFANPALRSQFSSTVVPYVLLVPWQDQSPKSSAGGTADNRRGSSRPLQLLPLTP